MANKKKPSGAVRLWGWKSAVFGVQLSKRKWEAKQMIRDHGGTYLGEYIARPVREEKMFDTRKDGDPFTAKRDWRKPGKRFYLVNGKTTTKRPAKKKGARR